MLVTEDISSCDEMETVDSKQVFHIVFLSIRYEKYCEILGFDHKIRVFLIRNFGQRKKFLAIHRNFGLKF